MAHGTGNPNLQIPDHILAVLPTDPRAQIDIGLKIISRAIDSRKLQFILMPQQQIEIGLKIISRAIDMEILLMRQQDPEIAELQDRIAQFTLAEPNTCLPHALEDKELILKQWVTRSAAAKLLIWRLFKNGGVGNVEEFNRLLAKITGLKESDVACTTGIDVDMVDVSPVLALEEKETPADNQVDKTPTKTSQSRSALGISSRAKPSKAPELSYIRDDRVISSDFSASSRSKQLSSLPPSDSRASSITKQSPSLPPISEVEIKTALLQMPSMTTYDLVSMFRERLKSQKEKSGFTHILRRIAEIRNKNGKKCVVLREKHRIIFPYKKKNK